MLRDKKFPLDFFVKRVIIKERKPIHIKKWRSLMDDFKFNIEKSFGFLSETKSGWKTELNLVSWSERPAKFDLRPWAPEHDKMGKGITLTREELLKLREILDQMDLSGQD